jgi:tripartite-type tricarboxylate transporter receptor subunit TctC
MIPFRLGLFDQKERHQAELISPEEHSMKIWDRWAAVAVAMAVSLPGLASAEDSYPNRPIELWVGYSAGSGTDAHARVLAPALSEALGASVVVVNKGGAGGLSMWSELAHAKPDGYTLGIINFPALATGIATTKLSFDPFKDLTYFGNATADAVTLAVSTQSPYKSIDAVVEAAKNNPGKLSVGITGRTSQDFLTARSIEKETGAKFKYLVFPGNNEGINALLGGHIDMMTMVTSTAANFYSSGQMDMLAVGVDERMPDFPKVPTFKEKGINLFGGGALNYKALGAPAGLPPEIQAKISDALVKIVKDPNFVAKVKAMGSFAYYMDGPSFEKLGENQAQLVRQFVQN